MAPPSSTNQLPVSALDEAGGDGVKAPPSVQGTGTQEVEMAKDLEMEERLQDAPHFFYLSFFFFRQEFTNWRER